MKLRHLLSCCALLSVTVSVDEVAASPAIHSSCAGYPVASTLSSARALAVSAASRLNGMSSMTASQRKSAWNSGAERRWFGDFSELRFRNVRDRMNGIATTLNDSKLDVVCNWTKDYFGHASPAIKKITLGLDWKVASSSNADKPQTFVHEAAHIRGAVLGGEARGKYGVSDALTRAQKWPGVAVRTAENVGYYAVCRSPSWAGRGGCP